MRLVEILESRKQALRVSEVATLSVTNQHIYKMTAKGMIPSLRIAGEIRCAVHMRKAQRGSTLQHVGPCRSRLNGLLAENEILIHLHFSCCDVARDRWNPLQRGRRTAADIHSGQP